MTVHVYISKWKIVLLRRDMYTHSPSPGTLYSVWSTIKYPPMFSGCYSTTVWHRICL